MSSSSPSGRVVLSGWTHGYVAQSRRPLQILIFLLPLLIVYELAMLNILRLDADATQTVRAHKTLVQIFDILGIHAAGWFVPGLAVIVVLLVWHILSRESWRVDWSGLAVMAAESAALAAPLLVLAAIIDRLLAGTLVPETIALTAHAGPAGFGEVSLIQRLALSIGAGIYEELVFRMLMLALLHTLFINVLKWREQAGMVVAIIISAVLFSLYHFDLTNLAATFSLPHAVFYFLAGIYLGVVYWMRGFGIVVATHAFYDVIVAVLA